MNKVRRRLVIASTGLIAPGGLVAQPKRRVARIGVLAPFWTQPGPVFAPLRDALRELGYVEGRDIVFEARSARGDLAKLPDLAQELVQKEVDVIVVGGTITAQAAKGATKTIPIVAHGVADLAESGLVASLARPGGNLTGVAVAFPETSAKQLEIMLEILPQGRRVAVLWPGPRTAFTQSQRNAVEARANSGLEISWYAPRTKSELQLAFKAIQDARPDFLLVLAHPFFYGNRKEIAQFAAGARIPAAYGFREHVDDGGLISYGASLNGSLRRAAVYVDKILKGAHPAELPVELPTKFELAVNTKAARDLGIRIPQSLLVRADVVVE